MKERLTTLALAAAALALFYTLFVPHPPAAEPLQLPLSTNKSDAGYQALWRWLQAERIPVKTLNLPYSQLASLDPANPTGAVLITTLPQRVPMRGAEAQDLDAWIMRGNTVVVLAALDDTPPWAVGGPDNFLRTLGRMTRLKFEVIEDRAEAPKSSKRDSLRALQTLAEPQRIVMRARAHHPLFEDITSLVAESALPASRWRATSMDTAAFLEIGERVAPVPDRSPDPAVWLKPYGRGQILVISCATLFSNKLLGEADNARFFANILAWSRSAQALVIFDDDHQGAVGYYDAKAFFADPRLHHTLLWIVAAWLLFVLGWQRRRPAITDWQPVDVTNFIAVTGGFLAGSVRSAAAAVRLFENFFNSLRHDLALPQNGAPLWEWLAANGRIEAQHIVELETLHAQALAGRPVDLVRLHQGLSRLKGILE